MKHLYNLHKYSCSAIFNRFVPNALFLYPLKTSENRKNRIKASVKLACVNVNFECSLQIIECRLMVSEGCYHLQIGATVNMAQGIYKK